MKYQVLLVAPRRESRKLRSSVCNRWLHSRFRRKQPLWQADHHICFLSDYGILDSTTNQTYEAYFPGCPAPKAYAKEGPESTIRGGRQETARVVRLSYSVQLSYRASGPAQFLLNIPAARTASSVFFRKASASCRHTRVRYVPCLLRQSHRLLRNLRAGISLSSMKPL